MAILVTGGAGFIGSHLCDRLLSEGKKVICLDCLDDHYFPGVKINNIIHNLNNPHFIFFAIDITNKNKLENIFSKYHINKIVHLAARAGVRPSIQKPLDYAHTNILGTLNLLEFARRYKISSFVFGSSSSVYGKNMKIPFNEDDNASFPESPYAASKRACELYCFTYNRLFNLNIVCLRFFTVYGPRSRPDMAPYLFTSKIISGEPISVFGDGSTKRDYTYVLDIVEGIISALDKNLGFEIINLGNSNPITLSYFISLIENAVGKKALKNELPMQPGDVPLTYADCSKAERMLGYKPKTSIEEGIKEFVNWFKNEKDK